MLSMITQDFSVVSPAQKVDNFIENTPPLVTYTGTDSAIDSEGVFSAYSGGYSSQLVRRRRYRLKAVVNRFFSSSRTSACMRLTIPDKQVSLFSSAGRAFYSGLAVCANVWMCPVCAAKISERRRIDLRLGLDSALSLGYSLYFLTFTVRHALGDDLSGMLDMMSKAWRKTSTGRRASSLRDHYHFVGTIRALEVTDGLNGFHPHYHLILITSSPIVDLKQFHSDYYPLWRDACVSAGLPEPTPRHGFHVQTAEYVADYVTKWGCDSELTKSHIKTAGSSVGGMTPFDMLRDWADNQNARSIKRFAIYVDAFKGRRQLYWSNGLRDHLGLDNDATDDQLALESKEDATLLALIRDDHWHALRRFGLSLDLLDLAERHPDRVDEFLIRLRSMLDDVGYEFDFEQDAYLSFSS